MTTEYIEGIGEIPIIPRAYTPKPDIPFKPCTKLQRQRLDLTSRQMARLTYVGLMKFAGEFLDRSGPIRSWGEVSSIDANRLIMELEGRQGKVRSNDYGVDGTDKRGVAKAEKYGRY